jgi:hypothetical protein
LKPKFAYLFSKNPLELFCGRVLGVANGVVRLATIDALGLCLYGDGDYDGNIVSRPIRQATFFDDRYTMLDSAKNVYRANAA